MARSGSSGMTQILCCVVGYLDLNLSHLASRISHLASRISHLASFPTPNDAYCPRCLLSLKSTGGRGLESQLSHCS